MSEYKPNVENYRRQVAENYLMALLVNSGVPVADVAEQVQRASMFAWPDFARRPLVSMRQYAAGVQRRVVQGEPSVNADWDQELLDAVQEYSDELANATIASLFGDMLQ